MEYINIKGLTTKVSDISFGTATSTLEDETKIHDMLDYYVSVGGNYIDTADEGKDGAKYAPRHGVCFETQFPPNAINVPTFPHPVAKAGEEVVTTTIYKFVNA